VPEKPSYEELEQRVKELEEEAVEGKRAEEEAQRRVAQLELIYEVHQRIISKLEPETLLSEIVNSVHDGFDYYSVILLLVDENTNRLTMQSIAGGYATIFPKDLWLAIGEGMIGYAAETAETQVSGDVSKHPHYVCKAKEETKSELVVPIKSEQKVLAVLDLQSNEFDAFDDTDVMVMETLADQIAVAIENAQLYDAVQQELAERKQAEDALRESETQKTAILDGSIDRIRLVDKDLRIIWANKTTTRELNMTSEDLAGKTCYEFLAGRDTPCPGCPAVKTLTSGKIEHALMHQTKSKTIKGESYWDDYAVPIKNESGDVVTIIEITRNVTEQKWTETELIQAKNFLQNILDSSIDGITTTDLQGKIIYTSPKTKDILGYEQEAVISKKVYSLYGNGIEDAKTIMEELMAKGEIKDHEMTLIRKDNTLMEINLSASLLRNEEGEIIGTLGTYRDITEKNRLEAQLAQVQRMEALGTLAGGIAHNFNNLLMGIQGNASLMLLEIDPDHPNHQRLKTIEKSVQSGSRLTRQLLGYAREGRYEIKPISLNQLVKETSDTFSMTKKEIRFHQELAQDLCGIRADQGQIEQALLNLYVNATDAMPRGGDIFLKTINVKHKDIKKKPFKPKPGNYVLLTVRDTGTGMDKVTMKRIFEPFFTTKGLAKGTGLGLASTYGIIKAHGGYIDVDSKNGHGTTFIIYLPASEKRIEKSIKSTDQIIKGKGAILLVDDEEIVLDASFSMLKKLGYTVLKAKGGREAVEIYKENKDKINMVLLDVIMPGMSGGQAYDRMKEINPDIKVLLSSGYDIEGQATEILERGCNGFIQKPFNLKELSQNISKILDKE